MPIRARLYPIAAIAFFSLAICRGPIEAADPRNDLAISASSTAEGGSPAGAVDRQRFSTAPATLWRGKPGEPSWWWEARFSRPRTLGAILQVVGDHELALRCVPKEAVWQASSDGLVWEDLRETAVRDERRMYRIHRLSRARQVRALRLAIATAGEGSAPALREVEFFEDPAANIPFPPWAVVVTTTGDTKVPGEGRAFVPLARACRGWETLQAQNVWLGDFREAFLAIEPQPLCAFLSGNFIDWCQQDRNHWQGVAEVLNAGRLPIWASCGGAQGLAILAEHGVDSAWDCPHCRDSSAPKTPIYGHIGHTARRPCGDYSACLFERGPRHIRKAADDPAFAGLPHEFLAVESHCGQIEWVPKGWVQIAAGGRDALTKVQCLRRANRYIYAAQFHIENAGTPETSRTIMTNFLRLAQEWGGYNPNGKPPAPPKSLDR
jgi:hypothetical protein